MTTYRSYRLLALLTTAAALGACGETGVITLLDPIGETQPRIVNGQVIPESDHPAVGKLTHSGSLCTATLVGKKTVLTAAHCVTPGATHYFRVGGVKYTAAWAKRHPQYNSYQISNDIAIVMLQQEPPITPAAIAISAPTQGLELTIVGYGKTGEYNNDAGTKRKTVNSIDKVTTTRISFYGASGSKGNICNGDSGGPSFATLGGHYVQVGVHSTKSGSCGSGGNDMRVDYYQSWIEQTAGGDVIKPGPSNPGNPSNPGDPGDPGDPGNPSNPGPAPGDTTPPQVAITSPAALADVSPNVTIKTMVADDRGVVKVELHVGGQLAATRTQPPYDFGAALPQGTQTVQVFAFDAAGNKGEATISVNVTQPGGPAPDPGQPDPGQPDPGQPDPGQPDPGQPDPGQPSPSPGAFGQPCSGGNDCRSGLCAADPALGSSFCTESCSAAVPCPAGAQCFSTPDPNLQVCGAPQVAPAPNPSAPGGGGGNGLEDGLVGGCSVAGSAASSGWPLFALLALLGLVGRRSRRRSR